MSCVLLDNHKLAIDHSHEFLVNTVVTICHNGYGLFYFLKMLTSVWTALNKLYKSKKQAWDGAHYNPNLQAGDTQQSKIQS